jgi:hypothetical protein
MQVAFHLGVHDTDEDRLVRCLLKNKGKLAEEGIIVPGPSRYRALLRDTINALRGAEATPEAQAVILEAVLEGDGGKRLILSNEQFLCLPDKVLGSGKLYPLAGRRARSLANLFPRNPVEFHLGIRNPATLLPAVFARLPTLAYDQFVAGSDLTNLHWADTLASIREAVPDAPITVWCNEDTPLIWPEIVAAVTRHDPATELEGVLDLAAEIMSPDGVKWMQTYLANHRPQSVQQRRRIITAFLAKFSQPEKTEVEIEMPGWTQALIEQISDTYEQDIAAVRALSGVTFIGL